MGCYAGDTEVSLKAIKMYVVWLLHESEKAKQEQ